MLSNPPIAYPSKDAHGLITSLPNIVHNTRVPRTTLVPNPQKTHRSGTSRSGVSTSASSVTVNASREVQPWAADVINSATTGKRDTTLSAHMIASDTQRIHPREPVDMSPTGPGAQPSSLASGDRMAHPTIIPWSTAELGEGWIEIRTHQSHAKGSWKSHYDPLCGI